jgi:hypothetical protein
VRRSDVLSLVAQALFFRFLRDCNIIKEENCPKIAPCANWLAECFDNAENAAAICLWLDNPPWTSLEKTDKALALDLDRASRAIVTRNDAPLGKHR